MEQESNHDNMNEDILKSIQLENVEPMNSGINTVKEMNCDPINATVDVSSRPQYTGLVNQGNTCYLNSVIQTLFHLPYFRERLYSIENVENIPIALALRNIFAELHCGNENVTTTELTQAFGWSTNDTLVQHDVHEMMQKLFDTLENECKGTPHENFIRDCFHGEQTYITRAVDGVSYTAHRKEGFYDVELVVQDKESIYASLDQWCAPERIEGVSLELEGNRESVHTVERSQRFSRLPPVLLIHPNRVFFSQETCEIDTLNTRWVFPESLDLRQYVLSDTVETPNGNIDLNDTEYVLRSIIIHQGTVNNGHYYAFVRFENEWVCFNDNVVYGVSVECIGRAAFGGYSDAVASKFNERASLLVYVKKSVESNDLNEKPLPEMIKNIAAQLKEERESQIQQMSQHRERCEKMKFQFVSDEEFLADILDGLPITDEEVQVVTASISISINDLHAIIAERLNQSVENIRVWSYISSPRSFIAHTHIDATKRSDLFVEVLPKQMPGLHEEKKNEREREGEADNEASPFFALVRIVHGNSLSFHGVVHSRKELKFLLKQGEAPMIFFVRTENNSLVTCSLSDVRVGSNVIVCPESMRESQIKDILHFRKRRNRLLVLCRINLTKYIDVGTIRFTECTYAHMQEVVFKYLRSRDFEPLPPSKDFIGFHTLDNPPGSCICPSLSVLPIRSSGNLDVQYFLNVISERSEIAVTVLPKPLCYLDTRRIVVFNFGGGVRPLVYVKECEYKLSLLYDLAIDQVKGILPQKHKDQLNRIGLLLRAKKSVLRLIKLAKDGRIENCITNLDANALTSHGLYVIDIISETSDSEMTVNVFFSERHPVDEFFGFPTNIAVSKVFKELGIDVMRRIVSKVNGTEDEDAINGCVVAAKNAKRVSRTIGRNDSLKKLVDELGELDCFVVYRSRSLLLDNVPEPQRVTEQSIIIKPASARDLASTSNN